MWVSELRKEDLTPDIIDRLLFEGIEDHGEGADCIIVLGSRKAMKLRVPRRWRSIAPAAPARS